ncbi:MAG: YigZ family protein [Oscillospiraceae bacterium]|nr:YigZ family protein [Oscillospiraceae bacterium]
MTGYLTAAGYGEALYEDRHSRFYAHVRSVTSEIEARAFLEEIRARYPDATHHVYAYLLREGNILRWSDDGEPGGTSGQPTLGVLQGAGLTDVICVTARYFGGTLLGSGGLVRAYSTAARLALSDAGTARMTPWRQGAFTCSYARYERLRRLLTDRGARIEECSFGENVAVLFSAPESQCESVGEALREFTAGEIEVAYGRIVFRPTE